MKPEIYKHCLTMRTISCSGNKVKWIKMITFGSIGLRMVKLKPELTLR